jgi:ATP-dependent 26S proteasome regulatory subunit
MGRLTGVTIVILSGEALHAITLACSVARALTPSLVIIEDVDLIGDDRGMHPGAHPLLFQLLNEMDGLGEDLDIAFLLTTNRADLLERALVQRPGRVDQAVEIPLPEAAERKRLVELYCGRLELDEAGIADVVERSHGVTASFLKELLRRAALLAAQEESSTEGPLRVSGEQLTRALDLLLDDRSRLTRALLGSPGEQPA